MGRGRRGGLGRPGGNGGGSGHGNPADGKKTMQQLARETGGGFYEVSKKSSLDRIYAQVEEELRNQYNLGYTPDGTAGRGYRRIELTVPKRKDLAIQAREGYYADK